ncbi:hypothetical protein ACVBKF_29335 [Shewanella sp. 0m-11]
MTRQRIYIETMQTVLPAIESKIIIDEQTRNVLPFLDLKPKQDKQGVAHEKD